MNTIQKIMTDLFKDYLIVFTRLLLVIKVSQTCIKKSPLGQRISGLI
jgi:hypothetical protein